MTNNSACCFFQYLLKLLLIVILSAGRSHAVEVNVIAGYEGQYSDNINLAESNVQEEFIHSPFVALVLADRSVKYNGSLDARLEYQKYQFETNEDEFVLNLGADFLWSFRPDQFEYIIDNNFTQTFVDFTNAANPGNRQNVNLFTTGPNASFRFSQLNTLDMAVRYTNVYAEVSENSNQYSTLASWEYQFSATRIASLNYGFLYTDFVNPVVVDSFRSDLYVRTSLRPARSDFTLDLGLTYINQLPGENMTNLLARLDWTMNLSSTSTVSLNLGANYSNRGIPAEDRASADPNAAVESLVISNIFYEKSAEFMFDRTGSFTSLGFSLFYNDRKSVDGVAADVATNRSMIGSTLNMSFARTQSTTWDLNTLFRFTDYDDTDQQDQDIELSIIWNRRMNRTMIMGLQFGSNKRDSTLVDSSYDELRAMITVAYSRL